MRFSIALTVAVLASAGCAGKATTPETTARGTLALQTFPSAPTAVVATSGAGVEQRVRADAAGAFVLSLPKGQSYALGVEVEGRRVPVAMPRRSGRIERVFQVSSDGVVIELGAIRYRAAGATDSPSANDPAGAQCGDGTEGDTQNDGECDNGVDTNTHAACSDPIEPSGDIAASDEMALPESDPPRDASGCDSHGASDGQD